MSEYWLSRMIAIMITIAKLRRTVECGSAPSATTKNQKQFNLPLAHNYAAVHNYGAFQASSPKTFMGRLWAALFLS
jgi:hypothetical protein